MDELQTETTIAAIDDGRSRDSESIVRNTTIVGAFLFAGRVAGIFREVVISRVIGTSAAADAFRFASETVLQDIYTKVEKLLQPIYVPIFVARQREDGDVKAWKFTDVVGTVQVALLILLAGFGVIFAPQIVSSIARHEEIQPGTEGYNLAVAFLRMFFPALIIYSLSNLAELTIQSYKHFTIPALAETVRRILPLVAIVALVAIYRKPSPDQATVALAWGVVAGCVARMLIQIPKLWDRHRLVRLSLALSNPDVRKAAFLAMPLVVGIAFAYGRNLIEAYFAFDEGSGAFSALKYSRKVVDMPWQVLSLALSYVIYPFISEMGAKQDKGRMADAMISVVRVMVFVFAPLTLYFLLLGEPVIRLAFFGGQFDEESVRLTNSALPFYVMGLIVFAIEDPLLKWFFAMSDTITPIALGVVADLIWFGAAYWGVEQLDLGLPALAAAFSIAKIAKVVTVLVILRARLGRFPLLKTASFFGKVAVACAVMGALIHFASKAVEPHIPFTQIAHGLLHHAIHLMAMAAVGGGVFLVGCAVLKVEELQLVVERLRKRLRR